MKIFCRWRVLLASLVFLLNLHFYSYLLAEVEIEIPEIKAPTNLLPEENSSRPRLAMNISSWAPKLEESSARKFSRSKLPSLYFGIESASWNLIDAVKVSLVSGMQPTLLERNLETAADFETRSLRQRVFLLPLHLGLSFSPQMPHFVQWLDPSLTASVLPTWFYRESMGVESESQKIGVGGDFSFALGFCPKILDPFEVQFSAHYTLGSIADYSLEEWSGNIGVSLKL